MGGKIPLTSRRKCWLFATSPLAEHVLERTYRGE